MRDFKKISSNNGISNRRSSHTTDREETPIAKAKNHIFVNNSKHLLSSPIEQLKSSLATSSSIVDAMSMPSQNGDTDDVNKTFDSLLQSMTRKNDSRKRIGRRKISSSSSINNGDKIQGTDSDDDDDDDSSDHDRREDSYHHHHQSRSTSPMTKNNNNNNYQGNNISSSFDRYNNNNPTTPHNNIEQQQSFLTTHHSSIKSQQQQQSSSRKKTMKSTQPMLSESTYDREIVNLRSQVEELTRRVTQQSRQLEQCRHELQLVRETNLSVNNSNMPGQL